MATTHITPFPSVPPMPFPMPNMPSNDEMAKNIRGIVEQAIVDAMNDPSNNLGNAIKKHVKDSLECEEIKSKLSKMIHGDYHEMQPKKDEKSDLETLFCEITKHHKHIYEGKSTIEVEHEIAAEHPDMTPEETRVLSCLLRSDGPVRLASIIGMEVETFIDTMKHLGKRFKK